MKAIRTFVGSLVKDEQGGEVLEYALIAGLIVVAAIAVIGTVGGKVLARWSSFEQLDVRIGQGRQARLPAGAVRGVRMPKIPALVVVFTAAV